MFRFSLALTALLLIAPTAASAATRYASAAGSGSTCSQAAPCGIKTAIESASNGDTIELAADEYNLVGAAPGGVEDYKGTIQVTANNLTIKGPDNIGDASTHVPFLLFSGNSPLGTRILIDGATPTIRNIAVSGTATQALVGTSSGNPAVTLDRVLFLTSSDTPTFEGDNATITNSVFRQTGPGAFSRTIDITGSISNSFVYSANNIAIASINSFHKPPNCSLTIRNTIAWGKVYNLSVSTTSNNPIVCTSMSTNYDYSWIPNVASAELGGGIENDPVGGRPVTITAGSNNLANTAAVTGPTGVYDINAASPTVNAGTAISDHDYYGRPRPIGAAHDIGPYEASLAPTASGITISEITTSSAKFTATVNPNFLTSSYHFEIRKAGSESWTNLGANALEAGISPLAASGQATGLEAGSDYQVRLVASNTVGETAGAIESFRTTAIPEPPTQLTVTSLKSKVSKKTASLTSKLNVSKAGKISQKATSGKGKKTKTWCKATKTVTAAGNYTLTCKLTKQGRKYLKKKSLKLTVTTSFAPSSGTTIKKVNKVTIKKKR